MCIHITHHDTHPIKTDNRALWFFEKGIWATLAGVYWCICETNRVSSGTLLLRAQLSWSWTDSGVEGPSGGAALGAWLCRFLRLAWLLRLRELADDWWWLCGGGRGGRREVWLWWLDAPERDRERRLITEHLFLHVAS